MSILTRLGGFQQRVVQTMQQQEASGIKEGVYNHLHSADQKDRSDYYDHAAVFSKHRGRLWGLAIR